MDTARLILDFIKALVWPLVALTIAWRYRSHLDRLARRVVDNTQELSVLGVRATFRPQTPAEREEHIRHQLTEAQVLPDPGDHAPDLLGAVDPRKRDVLNRYVFAEELVIRYLESTLGIAIERQVLIQAGERSFQVDGMARGERELTVIEVKYLTGSVLPRMVVEHAIQKATAIKSSLGQDVSLIFCVVSTRAPDEVEQVVQLVRPLTVGVGLPVRIEGFTVTRLVNQLLGTREGGS